MPSNDNVKYGIEPLIFDFIQQIRKKKFYCTYTVRFVYKIY